MKPPSLSPTSRAVLLLSVLLLSVTQGGALLLQFFKIQVLEHDTWKKRADGQHYIVIQDPYKRGVFYSNLDPVPAIKEEGPVPFVVDLPLWHLYADPKSIPHRYRIEVAKEIMRRTSLSPYDAKKMWQELCRIKHRSRRLISWISATQRKEIASWWYPYAKKNKIPSNALFFAQDFRRLHPMGHTLGQVLHTIQERRDEKTGKVFPTGGLELSLDSYLKGVQGKRRLMRSPRNTLETGEILMSPVDGAHVELTINHRLQAIMEEELEKGVLQSGAKAGWAILLDPHTGFILGLAQYPFFHPDRYFDYFNSPEKLDYTKCRFITDANEPGSPTKAITAAIALKANRELEAQGKKPIFSPLDKINTKKGFFPGRRKELTDVSPHPYMNMYMAMQKSSNIYMAILTQRITEQMGDMWYKNALMSFGFGKKTGVELLGESAGILPTPGKIIGNGKLEWSKATPYSLAIGYNFQATTLQMARAYCVLANGGTLPDVTLIKRIYRPSRTNSKPEILVDNTDIKQRSKKFVRVLEPSIVAEVVQAMKFVTKPGGGAAKGDIYGYTEAGKTGTTMKLVNGAYTDKSHFSSFIGFAPAHNARFVLAIGVDEPKVGYIAGKGINHRGSACATPIFREIGRRVLEAMNVPQDDPTGYPKGDPRSDLEKSDWYHESISLKKLLESWDQNKVGSKAQ